MMYNISGTWSIFIIVIFPYVKSLDLQKNGRSEDQVSLVSRYFHWINLSKSHGLGSRCRKSDDFKMKIYSHIIKYLKT